jgi:hypothetical protein
VGFAGAFRKSELVALNGEDLQFCDEAVRVAIRRSNTDQEGKRPDQLRSCAAPVRSVRCRCCGNGRTQLALLRVRCSGRWPKGGERGGDRVGGRAYYDVIKQGIAGIGLDAAKFGSHSMPSGWISTAARNGASFWKMKEISRHKSTDVRAG